MVTNDGLGMPYNLETKINQPVAKYFEIHIK